MSAQERGEGRKHHREEKSHRPERSHGVSSPFVMVYAGYEGKIAQEAARQRKEAKGILLRDPEGTGKVVVFVENPSGNKEYSGLIGRFVDEGQTLTHAEILATYAMRRPEEERSDITADTLDTLTFSQKRELWEQVVFAKTEAEVETAKAVNSLIKDHPKRVKVIVEWQDQEVVAGLAETKDTTFDAEDSVAAAKAKITYEAIFVGARNTQAARLIETAMQDDDVIGGVGIMPIKHIGITKILSEHAEDANIPKINVINDYPDVGVNPATGEPYDVYYLRPHDAVVNEAIEGVVPDEKIALIADAEMRIFDASTYHLPSQVDIAETHKWMEEETGFRIGVAGLIEGVEDLLDDGISHPEPGSVSALMNAAAKEYLEHNGLWDPSQEEIARHNEHVSNKIASFNDFWDLQITAKAEEYLDGFENPNQEQRDEVMHTAEQDILQSVSRMLEREVTDVEKVGVEVFLDTIKKPHQLAKIAKAIGIESSSFDGKGAFDLIMDYGRISGDALAIPEDQRREKPREIVPPNVDTPKDKEEKKVRYLMEKYIDYQKRIGLAKPTEDQIEQVKKTVKNNLNETQKFWEDYIHKRAADSIEAQGEVSEEARQAAYAKAEKEVMDMINHVSDTTNVDLEDAGLVYYKSALEDPFIVADRLHDFQQKYQTEDLQDTINGLMVAAYSQIPESEEPGGDMQSASHVEANSDYDKTAVEEIVDRYFNEESDTETSEIPERDIFKKYGVDEEPPDTIDPYIPPEIEE